MNIQETIKTWKWRIVRAGHKGITFSALLDVSPSVMSDYLNGKKKPSIDRFDLIEGKLRELEEALGV